MPLRHVAFLCKRTVDCQPFYNEFQQSRSFSGEVVSNCTFCFKSQIKTPHLKWPYRRQKNLWTALYAVCCYNENNLTMTYNMSIFHSTVHCCYDENNLTMTYNRPVFHSTVHCLLLRWEQSMTHMPVFLQHWTSSVVTMRTIWLWRICQGESINWKGNDMLPNHNIKAVNWGRGIIIKDGKHACFSLKQKYNTVISSNAKCFMPSMSRAIGDCTVYNLTGGHFTQTKSICFQISTNYTMCSCILWYTDLLN